AGLGAAEAGITGGDPGKGALFGALSGGAVGGLGPAISGLTGLGTTAGDTLASALGGDLGGLATGQKGLAQVLEGAAGGLAAGALSGSAPATGQPSAGGSGGGVGSAASAAAPAGVGAVAPDAGLNPVTAAQSFGADALTGPVSTAGLTSSVPQLDVLGAGVGGALGEAAGSHLGGDLTGGAGDVGAAVSSNLPGSVGAGAAAPGGLSAATGFTTPNPVTAAGSFGAEGLTGPASTAGLTPTSVPGFSTGGATAAPAANQNRAGLGGLTKDLPLLLAGANLLKGNQLPPQFGALSASAQRQAAQGQQLEGYLASGTLPPGMQASLNAAQDAASASIRSEYASRGMSGSSAEAQDIASLGQRVQAQGEQLALQLFSQGVSETQASDALYQQLMSVQMQQDQNLSNAVGKLASSFALMGSPLAATGS